MKRMFLWAAVIAASGIFAAEWDFTAGVPAGGKLAPHGYVTESGLASHSLTNIRVEGGYRLDKPFAYPMAFRLEVEAEFGLPDSEIDPKVWRMEYLWDDIGETPNAKAPKGRGVSLMLQRHGGEQRLFLRLGYGDCNEVVQGPEVNIPRGTRAKIAFTYTANGKVIWETPSGRREDLCVGRGQIPSNTKPATKIGDRIWPNWYKFDGVIRRVAVIPVERELVELSVASPRAFLRASGKRDFRVSLTNFADEEIRSVELTLVRGEERIVRRLEGVSAAGSEQAVFPVETCLKPGWRDCVVTATGVTASGRRVNAVLKTAIGIGPRPGDRMLALMQDSNDLVKECAENGVTVGQFGDGSQFFVRDIPADRNPFIRRLREKLDEALVVGVGYGFSGKRDQPTFEDAPAFEHVWEDYGRAFAEYDAFQLAVPYSERRDKSQPDLQKDAARFKAATGLDMPKEVVSNRVARFKVKSYPDGVVPENDPVLAFYRWYWSGGDRWPEYFDRFGAAIRRGVGRTDFQTLWDPSVRCPPRWGSGGGNNLLSQWIYADPEPMAVAGSAEEVLAMCAGRPGQKPVIHTQLMCYSRRIAPSEVTVSPRPAWQDRFGGGKFLATPADIVCEATWLMFAKPMYGYSFYPFTCMVETPAKWYPYSDPRLGPEMKRLLKDVLAPLGPIFKRLGRAEPEVAVFESFTSTVLGAPFAMGWNAPPVTFMQRANLDPKVVYEETLERDGFGNLKVVFAPNCRYLTPKLVNLFRDFQSKGGVLVGDDELAKALKADIIVPTVRFAPPPKSDWVTEVEENQAADPKVAERRAATRATKDAMCANAAKLRTALVGRYEAPSRSSSPDIIVCNRRFGETDYLFAVNDRRTFGDYVGQWGLLMEKGLPHEGQVAMRDVDNRVKAVYELSKGGEVPYVRDGAFVQVPVKYGTTDGRIFAFLHARIAKVEAQAAFCDGGIDVTMKVLDDTNRPLEALLPVEIHVYDAAGAELDGAGYCAAVNGVAEVHVFTNLDDARGAYRIVCRDRASGKSVTVFLPQPDVRRQEAMAEVERQIADQLMDGAVFATNDGVPVTAVGCRKADEPRHHMETNTRFDVASVTKPVTAACAALLAAEGKIDPNAPFTRYLPEHALGAACTITVADLASHTSGFTRYPYLAEQSEETYKAILFSTLPDRPRGETFKYNCYNLNLLGTIVERVSGERLDCFAARRIFGPLGMTHSGWGPVADENVVSFPHARKGAPLTPPGQIVDRVAGHVPFPIGNAGLFTTVGDLMLFAEDLLSRKTFPTAYYDLLFGCCFDKNGVRRSFGWDMRAEGRPASCSPKTIFHTGSTGQTLLVDPERHFAAVVLTARRCGHDEGILARRKIMEILARR